MTEDDKALVDRLRAFYQDICSENHEAADRIEALSAENERLANAIADRLLGSSIDGRTIKELVSENKKLREAMTWIKNNSDNRSVHYRVSIEALGETK